MGISIGIVGLPNVGKSTLFNALTQSMKAQAANYPFCTIEPNVGIVEVPDERLRTIARIEESEKIVPTFIEFVDIAGLVKGASRGEGLGNKFLAHIREMDAVAIVLRCFEDPNVVHVEGSVDPIRDADIIDIELIAKDLETVQSRYEKVEKAARGGSERARKELNHLIRIKEVLEDLRPLRMHREKLPEETFLYAARELFLLTTKPVMYIANVSEGDLPEGEGSPHVKRLRERAEEEEAPLVVICAEIEAQLATCGEEERKEFLEAYHLREPGLYKVIREGYRLLDLITFFTTGKKETRAWTIRKGTKALQAAGRIHSDMQRGFIAAEVVSYEDYLKAGSLAKAKELGLMRLEGKDYEVRDGDIIYFRFNV
ncbi:MAG TPA: redox-regulated ATPase YchF [Aquificaceae bacterium]|nr:redox-regulated ATPase YchF [Aquificaceae bacterium]